MIKDILECTGRERLIIIIIIIIDFDIAPFPPIMFNYRQMAWYDVVRSRNLSIIRLGVSVIDQSVSWPRV